MRQRSTNVSALVLLVFDNVEYNMVTCTESKDDCIESDGWLRVHNNTLSENQAMKPNLLRWLAIAIRAANHDSVSQEAPCARFSFLQGVVHDQPSVA